MRVQLITLFIGFLGNVAAYFMCKSYNGPKDDINLTIWIVITGVIFCLGGMSYIFDIAF